jgi:hypothetical protein
MGSQDKFAVKKVVKGIDIEYIPVIKQKGFFTSWIPIVKIFPNEYVCMPYESKGLTYDQCVEHIEGYKAQEKKLLQDSFVSTEYLQL